MRIIFIYFLTLSIIVCSDNEDIVETNIVNLKEYSVDKNSYCKERAEPKNLIWSQNFDENYLSPNVWNYSTLFDLLEDIFGSFKCLISST